MSRRILVSISAVAALALISGCDTLGDLGGEGDAPEASVRGEPGVLRVEEREVERPDIYSREARGLWDGRISLGGRWVAIPEDIKADRVKITNLSNGTIVEGALFQRDANLPGPYYMVSMDAAQALGMTPGVPADLNVIVVRTETVEIPAPTPVPAEETPAEDGAEAADGAAVEAGIATTALPDAGETAAPANSPLESTVLQALQRVESRDGAAAPAAAASADAGAKPPAPYLQVASGSNREGADAVARRLKAADLPAEVRTGGDEAAPVYRVVTGPFQNRGAYDAARATLREMGYEDAFATK